LRGLRISLLRIFVGNSLDLARSYARYEKVFVVTAVNLD
jgi:hypothetical protein